MLEREIERARWTSRSTASSNADLVATLLNDGALRSETIAEAMTTVDRKLFLPREAQNRAYRDEPLRHGVFHLSAPHVYCKVLETLDLKPGVSFLNIGSGSGYISHIVAAILGSGSINHGVELHQELVEFASSRCSVCPALRHINYISFMQGDAFQLDPGHRRYDRVYVGAGSMAQYSAVLHELIAVGGVMVVPQGNHLLCVRRESDGTFSRRASQTCTSNRLRCQIYEMFAICLKCMSPAAK